MKRRGRGEIAASNRAVHEAVYPCGGGTVPAVVGLLSVVRSGTRRREGSTAGREAGGENYRWATGA